MERRFLITTALEDSWPNKEEPVLFLGEWCCLHSKKKKWLSLDYKILKYHWDDRTQLYRDYFYLLDIYEETLAEAKEALNELHQVNYSIDYWRILIGPWLMAFIAIIFDRWTNLNSAISSYDLSKTVILDQRSEELVPNDMAEFSTFQENDEWNHYIYSNLLEKCSEFNTLEIDKREVSLNIELSTNLNKQKLWKTILSKLLSFFRNDRDHFLFSSRLSVKDFLSVSLMLRQFPVFYFSKSLRRYKLNDNKRVWKINRTDTDDNFIKILKELIPLHMPKSYLEGYTNLKEIPNKLGWPREPKSIFTSTAFHSDDVFKQWTGEKFELGIPFYIGQHGGNDGQASFSFMEYHELKVSSSFLSWGWTRNGENINSLGYNKKKIIKNNLEKPQELLLIISSYPRYSGGLLSMPISSQVLDYLKEQFFFYSKLAKGIQSDTTIRLYPHDYGWSVEERWLEAFSDINIDRGERNFSSALNSAKLIVSGWNTTTYLESLYMNKPTVIFWDSDYFELNDEAKEYFQELESVGIFHKDATSAAKHINEIWDNVEDWWVRPEVRLAKQNFVDTYIHENNNFKTDLKNILNSASR